MREQIIKKINETESEIHFTRDELEYILQDYVHLHSKCAIRNKAIYISGAVSTSHMEVGGAVIIDRKSIVNY